jgi:imidazole glycerol-phosphate synthase subunit HisH
MGYDAVLIDAGTGNLHSVQNALRSLGYAILVTADAEEVLKPGRVILPGVGAFGHFMEGLRLAGLDEAVRAVARRGDPLLGICVGMQALFETSTEMGEHSGLGLLKGRVQRFPAMPGLKIPQTGWNQLWQRQPSPLLCGLEDGAYAYFNHSYFCAAEVEDTAAVTDYGLDYCSSIWQGNILGVQFHPEKSQAVGKKILENFFSNV